MKKSICLLLALLLLPSVLALEIISNDEYMQGETVLMTVSGNFANPVLEKNIELYREHTRVPDEIIMHTIDEEYFISTTLLDKAPGNYSIRIKDVTYADGRDYIDEDIIIPFVITEETAAFSISPGVVSTKENFTVAIENLLSNKISVKISAGEGTFVSLDDDTFEIRSGATEKINLKSLKERDDTMKYIQFSADGFEYTLPLYVLATGKEREEVKEKDFEFSPALLNLELTTNTNKTQIIYLENTGEEDLENITIWASDELTDYIEFSVTEIEDLEKNESVKIELYISSPDTEEKIEGRIIARADPPFHAYLSVSLDFISDFIPTSGDTNEEPVNTQDPVDDEEEASSGSAKLIGWIIIIVLLAIIGWFAYSKYYGIRKSPVDLLKIAKGRISRPTVKK